MKRGSQPVKKPSTGGPPSKQTSKTSLGRPASKTSLGKPASKTNASKPESSRQSAKTGTCSTKPCQDSPPLKVQEYIKPGHYVFPMKQTVGQSSSPEKLRGKLQKYTPTTLSHWQNKSEDVFAMDIKPFVKSHPDTLTGNIYIPYSKPIEGQHISNPILDETLNPYAPEESWTRGLREAMTLPEEDDEENEDEENEDEDEDEYEEAETGFERTDQDTAIHILTEPVSPLQSPRVQHPSSPQPGPSGISRSRSPSPVRQSPHQVLIRDPPRSPVLRPPQSSPRQMQAVIDNQPSPARSRIASPPQEVVQSSPRNQRILRLPQQSRPRSPSPARQSPIHEQVLVPVQEAVRSPPRSQSQSRSPSRASRGQSPQTCMQSPRSTSPCPGSTTSGSKTVSAAAVRTSPNGSKTGTVQTSTAVINTSPSGIKVGMKKTASRTIASARSGLRPPSGISAPAGLRPPSRITAPAGTGLRPPSGITAPAGTGLRPPSGIAGPSGTGLRPPSGIKVPASKIISPPQSVIQPPKSNSCKTGPCQESSPLKVQEYVPPGRYIFPMKSAPTTQKISSPNVLRGKLKKYTPTILSHWQVQSEDPFAMPLQPFLKSHPDVVTGNMCIRYGIPPEEEEYESAFMEETLNPYAPENAWTMSLREAMTLPEEQGNVDDNEDEDGDEKFQSPSQCPLSSPTRSSPRISPCSSTRSPPRSPSRSPPRSPSRSPPRSPSRSPPRSPPQSPPRNPTHSIISAPQSLARSPSRTSRGQSPQASIRSPRSSSPTSSPGSATSISKTVSASAVSTSPSGTKIGAIKSGTAVVSTLPSGSKIGTVKTGAAIVNTSPTGSRIGMKKVASRTIATTGSGLRPPSGKTAPARTGLKPPSSIKTPVSKTTSKPQSIPQPTKPSPCKTGPCQESSPLRVQEYVPPGRYIFPMKSAPTTQKISSPNVLRGKLKKYTPTTLSHWQVQSEDPFAMPLQPFLKSHPDVVTGNMCIRYGVSPEEEEYGSAFMEETFNPYAPEDAWTMGLREATILPEEVDEDEEIYVVEVPEEVVSVSTKSPSPARKIVRSSPPRGPRSPTHSPARASKLHSPQAFIRSSTSPESTSSIAKSVGTAVVHTSPSGTKLRTVEAGTAVVNTLQSGSKIGAVKMGTAVVRTSPSGTKIGMKKTASRTLATASTSAGIKPPSEIKTSGLKLPGQGRGKALKPPCLGAASSRVSSSPPRLSPTKPKTLNPYVPEDEYTMSLKKAVTLQRGEYEDEEQVYDVSATSTETSIVMQVPPTYQTISDRRGKSSPNKPIIEFPISPQVRHTEGSPVADMQSRPGTCQRSPPARRSPQQIIVTPASPYQRPVSPPQTMMRPPVRSQRSVTPITSEAKLQVTIQERQVTPPKMPSPIGPVEAKEELKLEREARISPHGITLESRISGTKMIEPGVAKRIDTVRRKVIPFPSQTQSPPASAVDVETVNKLIAEENEDIDKTINVTSPPARTQSSPIKEKINRIKKKPKSTRILEECLDESLPADEDGEQIKSDVMASLIYSEEKNIVHPTESPKRAYDNLFPPLSDEPVVNVAPASPAPLQDIVVPIAEPDPNTTAAISLNIVQGAGPDALTLPSKVPEANIYAQTVGEGAVTVQKASPKYSEKSSKQGSYIYIGELESEKPPWDIDLGPLEELVGGNLSNISPDNTALGDESIRTRAKRLEYVLENEPPQHYSNVQLRGSQLPDWFPGYYSVFPYSPVTLHKSPSRVMTTAWRIFKPGAVIDNSDVVLV